MRTVDPEIWSQNFKKDSKKIRFGQLHYHRYETIFRKSLRDAASEYWENSSVPAVKYIRDAERSMGARYCYIFFLFATLGLGISVVLYNCHLFYMTPPLVVNGESAGVFFTDVSFPAVAVCSNNIISRQALQNYTEFLLNHPKNQKWFKYSRSTIEDNLSKLGALLTLALPALQPKFDVFLHEVDPHFNVTDVMFKLAPACSSILVRCSWRGSVMPCDELFAARVTPLGYCCVFNSRYYPVDANNKPKVLDMIGQNYGLGFIITENKDDFKYMRRNAFGAEMLIFEGSEYPLLESGDVRLFPIPRNQSLNFSIRSLTQTADDSIKYYNEKWRGCRSAQRGQSWCLLRCALGTSLALCGCVPYALHAAGTPHAPERVCALRDLPCLNKHREKFMYLYPFTSEHEEHLREEMEAGMACEQCLVRCSRQLYDVDISYSKYTEKTSLFHNYFTGGLSTLVNTSAVRLFYTLQHHDYYSVEAYLTWYEVIVKLSAQWILVGGVSVLGVVELIYHATFRLVHHFVRRLRLSNLKQPATSMYN